jgi:hypothetical protein
MYDPTLWPPRRRSSGVRVVLLAAALAVLGVIPLLGLPGAFIATVSLPVFGLSEGDLHPDASWPIALYISLLWPVGLILGYWVGFGLLKKQSEGRTAMAGVAIAWCLLLSLLFYAGAEKRKPAASAFHLRNGDGLSTQTETKSVPPSKATIVHGGARLCKIGGVESLQPAFGDVGVPAHPGCLVSEDRDCRRARRRDRPALGSAACRQTSTNFKCS